MAEKAGAAMVSSEMLQLCRSALNNACILLQSRSAKAISTIQRMDIVAACVLMMWPEEVRTRGFWAGCAAAPGPAPGGG